MTPTAPARDHFYRIFGVAVALVFAIAWGVPQMGGAPGSEVAVAAPDAIVGTVGMAR